jgi:hypothetical protein
LITNPDDVNSSEEQQRIQYLQWHVLVYTHNQPNSLIL